MVLDEDPTVTVKCTTAMQSLFLYSNLFLSVKLDSPPYSFTPISFFEDT